MKFRAFAAAVMDEERARKIEEAVLGLDGESADFKALIELLVAK